MYVFKGFPSVEIKVLSLWRETLYEEGEDMRITHISSVLIVLIVLALTGCGSQPTTTPLPTQTPAPVVQNGIAVESCGSSITVMSEPGHSLQEAFKTYCTEQAVVIGLPQGLCVTFVAHDLFAEYDSLRREWAWPDWNVALICNVVGSPWQRWVMTLYPAEATLLSGDLQQIMQWFKEKVVQTADPHTIVDIFGVDCDYFTGLPRKFDTFCNPSL